MGGGYKRQHGDEQLLAMCSTSCEEYREVPAFLKAGSPDGLFSRLLWRHAGSLENVPLLSPLLHVTSRKLIQKLAVKCNSESFANVT